MLRSLASIALWADVEELNKLKNIPSQCSHTIVDSLAEDLEGIIASGDGANIIFFGRIHPLVPVGTLENSTFHAFRALNSHFPINTTEGKVVSG